MSKHIITILLIGFFLCGCSYIVMNATDHYMLDHLGELTMNLSNKYLIGGWNDMDRLLLTFFPLLTGLGFILTGFRSVREYLIRIIWTFLILITSITLALVVALFTWQSLDRELMLLPGYIKHQPFTIYWTIFIFLGILGSMMPFLLNRKRRFYLNEPLDG